MSSQCIDLKAEISAKREELNNQLKNGMGKDILRTSRELDDLIVKYMLKQNRN